ncbi:MAG: glutamine--fructose-6-phosphate transaminase (isomerizing) [Acidobacteria bacterium]|nr:glutamine--fructose-6-phosphate transaminase (isomerizing) [Acidobacteriota bacterium]MBU1339613.1 glutamine--fructose-6-phosphate transaminase (isomerizing) [Acidobacteriota bacterium]MBU1474312.1 glutamine--fructose-6-phosphate transaminase (isomerizing) [Acidobacteriota bacterium]MBU4203359.1 glutamine--fructose-6-phosphate transaminase (isomerizing) [Acidobacteriota bacterium]
MCGIIGYIGHRDVVPLILNGLKKLEYRGYDSAGIAVVKNGIIERRRVKGKISRLEEELKVHPLSGLYGIGHTRWATHGPPSTENAHPHTDCTGEIVIVHNGIIENYLSIKDRLLKKGHVFKTETDTEVIAHLIEDYFETTLEMAVQRAVRDLDGAYSIVAISTRDPQKMVVVKDGAPAVVGIGENEFFVSSDVNPLLQYTKSVVFLEDREMAVVDTGRVKFLDFKADVIDKKIERLSWSPLMIEKKGYKHFMLKEIFEQPRVIRDTLNGRISLETGAVELDDIGLDMSVLKSVNKMVFIACGTSYHAGLVGKILMEKLAGVPVDVEYASEYRYKDRIVDENTLIVVISQSGETADSLAALKAVKAKGVPSLTICNVVKSSIARETDGALYTQAGPEIGVAATKTFTAQLCALTLLALKTAEVRGALSEEEQDELIQELQRIPPRMEEILNDAKILEGLSHSFTSSNHFLYLGRWISFPVALEGALKLKEISYIHAEAYPGGEMKHGPIALIDEKMPTLVVIPRDHVYEKMLSNISEVKTRSGFVLAVAFEDDAEICDRVDAVIRIPRIHPLLSPFLTTLPLQLFAYYIASARGADVDQPRNLAKSVTVE